ncbi:uncharacterized protein LOC110860351 [Folsomia candida]|uniref:Uncharacterized protein n=1 Tax=Folsomia candida TaxID=158441 RepID=A0A226D772_FOLCA|nr:uncharacterized protein LOC110860351 [Folsomia candida]OXA40960.1 hypothetical protein Fcan01_24337 [Folsomia candida]
MKLAILTGIILLAISPSRGQDGRRPVYVKGSNSKPFQQGRADPIQQGIFGHKAQPVQPAIPMPYGIFGHQASPVQPAVPHSAGIFGHQPYLVQPAVPSAQMVMNPDIYVNAGPNCFWMPCTRSNGRGSRCRGGYSELLQATCGGNQNVWKKLCCK